MNQKMSEFSLWTLLLVVQSSSSERSFWSREISTDPHNQYAIEKAIEASDRCNSVCDEIVNRFGALSQELAVAKDRLTWGR